MSIADYFTQPLKKDETVVAIIRKHWITLVWPVLIILVGVGLLIAFMDFFFAARWSLIVWIILLVAIASIAGYYWAVHYFDSFIITDMRIIDIDQRGLFKRVVSETTFDKVQDVTYAIVGFFATTMNYGTVSVQTGGAEARIELDHVGEPRRVQEILLEAQKLFKERHGKELSARELVELIEETKKANADSKGESVEKSQQSSTSDDGPDADTEE